MVAGSMAVSRPSSFCDTAPQIVQLGERGELRGRDAELRHHGIEDPGGALMGAAQHVADLVFEAVVGGAPGVVGGFGRLAPDGVRSRLLPLAPLRGAARPVPLCHWGEARVRGADGDALGADPLTPARLTRRAGELRSPLSATLALEGEDSAAAAGSRCPPRARTARDWRAATHPTRASPATAASMSATETMSPACPPSRS